MKTIRKLVPMASLVFLSFCQTGVANAQSANAQGAFRLQHEVHWGKAVLAAGDYSLTVDSRMTHGDTTYVVVRSADGKKVAVVMATVIGKPEPGGSFIFVANDGTRHVRLVNLPEQDLSLSFGPWSKRDREQLNTADAEVAPVTLAEK